MNAATTCPPPSGNLKLLALIVLLFVLPFAIAAALFLGGWKPSQTSNRGILLSPQPLALETLQDVQGKSLASLRGHWLLLLSGTGPCEEDCQRRIEEMRRVHVALYKGMPRVRRIVVSDTVGHPAFAAAQRQQPDLRIASQPSGWPLSETGNYRLGIVDPDGQLILSYPVDAPATDVRADFERLLKFSWNG